LNAKKTKGTFRSGQTSLHLTLKHLRWHGNSVLSAWNKC